MAWLRNGDSVVHGGDGVCVHGRDAWVHGGVVVGCGGGKLNGEFVVEMVNLEIAIDLGIVMAFRENGREGLAEVGGRERWVSEYGSGGKRF